MDKLGYQEDLLKENQLTYTIVHSSLPGKMNYWIVVVNLLILICVSDGVTVGGSWFSPETEIGRHRMDKAYIQKWKKFAERVKLLRKQTDRIKVCLLFPLFQVFLGKYFPVAIISRVGV